jgi:hypothetical protein
LSAFINSRATVSLLLLSYRVNIEVPNVNTLLGMKEAGRPS